MELHDVLRRLKHSGIAFLSVILIGVIGFGLISGGNWFDAFYMTAITITTIGFNEVIDLSESPIGRIFTVFIAFSGIGVMTYTFSNLAALFIEGDFKQTFSKSRMMKNIKNLSGHYIICGCGRVGNNIATELEKTNRPFVIADLNEDSFEARLGEKLVRMIHVSGDCTEDDFLKSLNIHKAKGIFATTDNDNTNLVITITAKQLNPKIKVVARTKAVKHASKLRMVGAEHVVTPNHIGGLRMASEMIRPAVTNFLDDMMQNIESPLRLEELIIPEKLNDKITREFPLSGCEQTLILAIKDDNNWVYNPYPDYVMKTGNHIILMTTPKERELIESHL